MIKLNYVYLFSRCFCVPEHMFHLPQVQVQDIMYKSTGNFEKVLEKAVEKETEQECIRRVNTLGRGGLQAREILLTESSLVTHSAQRSLE